MHFIFVGLHEDRIQDYLNGLPGQKVNCEYNRGYAERRDAIIEILKVDHIKETNGNIQKYVAT